MWLTLGTRVGDPGEGAAQAGETWWLGEQMHLRQRLELRPQAFAVGGAKYDRDILRFPDQAGRCEAVSSIRQTVIQDDHVGLQSEDGLNGLALGRNGGTDLMTEIA